MPPPPWPTIYVMLLQSLMIVTSTMMMSAVNCYDDHSGICAGPKNVCRHSRNMLRVDVTQFDIYFKFHAHAFDSPAVCRRLDGLSSSDANFKVYAYFSCSNLKDCFDCYDEAFIRMGSTNGCSGRDGGFLSLDGCCLRYETYRFCRAHN